MSSKKRRFWLLPVVLVMLLAVCLTAGATNEEDKPIRLSPVEPVLALQSVPDSGQPHSTDTAYDAIYQGLVNFEAKISLEGYNVSLDEVGELYYQVVYDNPELFYVKTGYTPWGYVESNVATAVEPMYLEGINNQEEVESFNSKVDEIIAETISEGMSELDKALALHDYLTMNCAYNWTVATATSTEQVKSAPQYVYTSYGALIEGDAVCQGYAMAYMLLLEEAGIEAGLVHGTSAMNHMWNWVKIGDEYYQTDVTWDDPVADRSGWTRYDYFLISDSKMGVDHQWVKGAPECTDTTYESGWAFNGNTIYLHYYDEDYYYVLDGGLYYGELDGDDKQLVAELGTNVWSGVWAEKQFYYTRLLGWYDGNDQPQFNHQIFCCDLTTGESAELGEPVLRDQQPSPDGYYPAKNDYTGLRIDSTGTKLELVSNNRRAVLYTVEMIDHPVAWEKVHLEENEQARLLGFHIEDGQVMSVGLLQDVEVSETWSVWVAFYYDGQMVGLREILLEQTGEELKVLEVNLDGIAEWTSAKMMLTDSRLPVCGSVSINNSAE